MNLAHARKESTRPVHAPAAPAHDLMAEQAHRLRSQELFDFAPVPSVTTDPAGIVVEANHAAAELFRTRKEFLPGKPLLLFLCERDRASHYGLLTRLRRRSAVVTGLADRLRVRPNEFTDLLLWAAPIDGESDDLIGSRWLFRDLSALGRMMAVQAHESRNLLQRGSACLDRLGWRFGVEPQQHDLLRRAQVALAALGRLYDDVRTVAGPLSIRRSGMGMGIAQRIVEAHGGRIVVGAEGPGAEFFITLPKEQP